MKNRVVGKRKEHRPPNIKWLKYKFKKVYDDKKVNPSNFLEMLLKNRITINFGTKSDPFQPYESKAQYTKQIVDLCNQYDQKLIFATKSDTFYDVDVTPDNHSFQLSFTNHYNDKYLEPNVPSFERRVEFYKELKDMGFKVGIRFEPFIPNITDIEKILSYFDDIDHIHISRLRLLPQINNTKLLRYVGLSENDFSTKGLTSLKGEVWYAFVKDTIQYLEENDLSYSSSFIHFGNSDCLGGDVLAWNCTDFDTFHLKEKYGDNWTMEEGLKEIGEYKQCDCSRLYTSNRRGDCRTVEDFYRDRWDNPRCKFNPKNQFKPKNKTLM